MKFLSAIVIFLAFVFIVQSAERQAEREARSREPAELKLSEG